MKKVNTIYKFFLLSISTVNFRFSQLFFIFFISKIIDPFGIVLYGQFMSLLSLSTQIFTLRFNHTYSIDVFRSKKSYLQKNSIFIQYSLFSIISCLFVYLIFLFFNLKFNIVKNFSFFYLLLFLVFFIFKIQNDLFISRLRLFNNNLLFKLSFVEPILVILLFTIFVLAYEFNLDFHKFFTILFFTSILTFILFALNSKFLNIKNIRFAFKKFNINKNYKRLLMINIIPFINLIYLSLGRFLDFELSMEDAAQYNFLSIIFVFTTVMFSNFFDALRKKISLNYLNSNNLSSIKFFHLPFFIISFSSFISALGFLILYYLSINGYIIYLTKFGIISFTITSIIYYSFSFIHFHFSIQNKYFKLLKNHIVTIILITFIFFLFKIYYVDISISTLIYCYLPITYFIFIIITIINYLSYQLWKKI